MIFKKPDDNLSFLYRAILMLQTEEECERFFDDLCTGPELKAIAQRLEVAKLLKEQCIQQDCGENGRQHRHHQPGKPFPAVRCQWL